MATSSPSREIETSEVAPKDAALELVRMLEAHFDDLGLSEEERDERYARAEHRVNAAAGESSTSSASH